MTFMVSMRFHADDPAAMRALIPAEQAHVRELTEGGTIHSLYLAVDGSRGWLVVQGESEGQVRDVMNGFPLRPYMEIEIVPLSAAAPV